MINQESTKTTSEAKLSEKSDGVADSCLAKDVEKLETSLHKAMSLIWMLLPCLSDDFLGRIGEKEIHKFLDAHGIEHESDLNRFKLPE